MRLPDLLIPPSFEVMPPPGPCGQGGPGPSHCGSRGWRVAGRAAGRPAQSRGTNGLLISLFYLVLHLLASLRRRRARGRGAVCPCPPPSWRWGWYGRWISRCQAPADTGRAGGAAVSGGSGHRNRGRAGGDGARGTGHWTRRDRPTRVRQGLKRLGPWALSRAGPFRPEAPGTGVCSVRHQP